MKLQIANTQHNYTICRSGGQMKILFPKQTHCLGWLSHKRSSFSSNALGVYGHENYDENKMKREIAKEIWV